MKKYLIIALIMFFILPLDSELIAQCSQCKLLAEQSGDTAADELLGGDNGNNINTAILYIMAVPYIILSFLFRKQIKDLFKRAFSRSK
ncbi:MAG: hypothetical protein R3277_02745 [Brumimicrobium sp.]|nr:hypothetical protein [Brumimicrobium sp.]